jgi:hypothetical protein
VKEVVLQRNWGVSIGEGGVYRRRLCAWEDGFTGAGGDGMHDGGEGAESVCWVGRVFGRAREKGSGVSELCQ